jgi:hypothetical protein
MFLKSGDWWIESKIDPRWNCSGRSNYCGGFAMPPECQEMIETIKTKLGEPPADLSYEYMKD